MSKQISISLGYTYEYFNAAKIQLSVTSNDVRIWLYSFKYGCFSKRVPAIPFFKNDKAILALPNSDVSRTGKIFTAMSIQITKPKQ